MSGNLPPAPPPGGPPGAPPGPPGGPMAPGAPAGMGAPQLQPLGLQPPPPPPLPPPLGPQTQFQAAPGMMTPPITDTNPDAKLISRDAPEPPEARRKLVERWHSRVKDAKRFWKHDFDRMRSNMEFVNGRQWDNDPLRRAAGENRRQRRDDRYVANIALRHVLQRTAELYPNNPTVKAKQRKKIIATTWDGTEAALQQAEAAMSNAAQMAAQTGMPPMPPSPQTMAILQDATQVKQYNEMMDRISNTLEILYDYEIQAQVHPFKAMMKMTVRRAIVTSVGFVKLGFQRAMKMSPEIEARIADMSERLANIERLSQDIADGEIEPDSADAESLRISIQTLASESQLIVREGLTFDYPDSTAIIPDKKCRALRGFLGSDWVAQEYLLSLDEIQEVYGVDVAKGYTAYDEHGSPTTSANEAHYDAGGRDSGDTPSCGCVWEIYSRKDGAVFVVCDGYKDFLQEPDKPDAELERFWPWFAFVLNEGYDTKVLYPQSDIDLLRDMQLELNRARQGLREHRRANRPKTAISAGILEEADKDKLRTHPANALIELNALAPGQKIDDVLQVIKMPPIDPAVYDTAPTFDDLLRVLGSDQADQGSTSGATATEVSVAQFSQHTDLSSVTDDMNDMLTELARGAGQLLMLNVSQQVVQEVVGPGAVWPQLNREVIVKNVYLEVDAGAEGDPNRQQDIQNLTQLLPILQRVPGISPEWMARQIIDRMGANIDITDAFAEGMPSIEALNQLMSTPPAAPPGAPGEAPTGAGKGPPRPGDPSQDPNQQGPQGLTNSDQTGPGTAGPLGPRVPPLQVFGVNGNRPGTGGALPRMRPGRGGMPTP